MPPTYQSNDQGEPIRSGESTTPSQATLHVSPRDYSSLIGDNFKLLTTSLHKPVQTLLSFDGRVQMFRLITFSIVMYLLVSFPSQVLPKLFSFCFLVEPY